MKIKHFMIDLFHKHASVLAMWGVRILIAIIIYFIGRRLIKMFLKIYANFSSKHTLHIDRSFKSFFSSFLKYALNLFLIIIILNVLGVQSNSFVAVLGALSVGIGLSLKDVISNILGGVVVLIVRPFKINDYISFNTLEGTVREITIFSTILDTVDNKSITINNGEILNQVVINYTRNALRRLDLPLKFYYFSDIKEIKEVISSVVEENPTLLKELEWDILVKNIEYQNISLLLRVWVKTEDYIETSSVVLEALNEAFMRAGIS